MDPSSGWPAVSTALPPPNRPSTSPSPPSALGSPGAIICLLSALSVHGLGTQLPREVWIAIPHKARTPRLPELPVKVVRFSGASLRYGVESAVFEGVPARITSPARTVVDCFRFRRLVGKDVALEVLGDALRERKGERRRDLARGRGLPREVAGRPGAGGAVTMSSLREIRDVPASVHQRLRNLARDQGVDFNRVLQRYAAERFLYRLSVSGEVDRFTLKGAALLWVWAGRGAAADTRRRLSCLRGRKSFRYSHCRRDHLRHSVS